MTLRTWVRSGDCLSSLAARFSSSMLLLNVTLARARIGVPLLSKSLCVMLTAVTRPLKIEF